MTFHVRAERLAPGGSLTIYYLNDRGEHEPFTTLWSESLAGSDGWRQFVFSENLPLLPEGKMRVAFEARNMSVSIDKLDLQSLAFPLNFELPNESPRQRLALVKIMQSARIALADGRVSDCQETLDSYWARFLTEYTPEVQQKPQPVNNVADDKAAEKADAPSVSSRWRSYIPGFFRN